MTPDPSALEKASAAYHAAQPDGQKSPHLRAAITAYLTEIGKTHVLVPRELDDDLIEGMFERTEGFPMEEIDQIHAALIAEIDGRNGK